MKFYNLKTRSHVEIPESEITKMKMVRPTKTGEQTRYAVKATYEGTPLTKFVKKDDYDALSNVKETAEKPVEKPATKAAAEKPAKAAPAKKTTKK